MSKFEACFMSGMDGDYGWEPLGEEFNSYSDVVKYLQSDGELGSGYAIFKDGVRILPNTKESRHELKVDKHNEIAHALDMMTVGIEDSNGVCYEHFFMTAEEIKEEEKEIAAAWKTLEKYGIRYTEEVEEKRRKRATNKPLSKPMPFIERHLLAIELDDLPF